MLVDGGVDQRDHAQLSSKGSIALIPVASAADDQLLDLRGALVEGGDAGVAQVALDRVVVDVAGAAVDLDRQVRALDRRLGRVELGDRGLHRVRLAFVLEHAGAVDQHPAGVALEDHVGDHLLDQLEAGERDAELLALLRVLDRGVDAAVADPDAAGGDAVAAVVERAHRDLEAVADLAEQRRRRATSTESSEISAVSEERRPSLPWISWVVKPSLSVGTRKQARPRCFFVRVGLGEDQRHVGEVGERDPHLLAADRPARVGLGRAGAEVGGVGAGVGLGQAEAAERLARAEPRQPGRLLLLVAPALDRAADQRGLTTETTVRAEESARPICSTISP